MMLCMYDFHKIMEIMVAAVNCLHLCSLRTRCRSSVKSFELPESQCSRLGNEEPITAYLSHCEAEMRECVLSSV